MESLYDVTSIILPMSKNQVHRFSPCVDLDLSDDFGSPERNLVAAVLNRAIEDVINPTWSQTYSERERAILWLLEPGNQLFEFTWCCDELGLCPDTVIRVVVEHKRDGKLWNACRAGRSGKLFLATYQPMVDYRAVLEG